MNRCHTTVLGAALSRYYECPASLTLQQKPQRPDSRFSVFFFFCNQWLWRIWNLAIVAPFLQWCRVLCSPIIHKICLTIPDAIAREFNQYYLYRYFFSKIANETKFCVHENPCIIWGVDFTYLMQLGYTKVLGVGVKSVNTGVVIGNKLENQIFDVSHSGA